MNVQLKKTFTLPLPFCSIPSPQIGWHPPTFMRAELLYSSTDSNTNLFQKHHHRHTRNIVLSALSPFSQPRRHRKTIIPATISPQDPAHEMVGTFAERRGQTPSLSLCLSPVVPLGHVLADTGDADGDPRLHFSSRPGQTLGLPTVPPEQISESLRGSQTAVCQVTLLAIWTPAFLTRSWALPATTVGAPY